MPSAHLRYGLVLAGLFFSACKFDLGSNAATEIAVSDLVVGSVDADGGAISATTFSKNSGFNQFVVTFALSGVPTDVHVSLASDNIQDCGLNSCNSVGGSTQKFTCACSYTVTDKDVEGSHRVVASATGIEGRESSQNTLIDFDFTPPTELAVQAGAATTFSFQPDSTNALPASALTALGPRDTALVQFGLNEPASTPPTLALDGGAYTVSLVSTSGTLYVYSVNVASPLPSDGPVQMSVTARDMVGNEGTFALDAPLPVKTSTPPAAHVGTPGAVVYSRTPWGSGFGASDTPPNWTLTAQAGAFPFDGYVIVFTNFGLALVETQVAHDQGLTLQLPQVDQPSVAVEMIDAAGNESPRLTVVENKILASMHNSGGSLFVPTNLNHFGLKTVLDSPATASTYVLSGGGPASPSWPEAADGTATFQSTASALYLPVTPNPAADAGAIWSSSGSGFAYDPNRAQWVGWGEFWGWQCFHSIFGFSPPCASQGFRNAMVTYSNGAWNVAENASPTSASQWTPVVYDSNRQTVVAFDFGSFAAFPFHTTAQLDWDTPVWAWPTNPDAGAVYALPTDGGSQWYVISPSGAGPNGAIGGAAAWNPDFNHAVVIANNGTWAFGATGWTKLVPPDSGVDISCLNGPPCTSLSGMSLYFDPIRRKMISMAGMQPDGRGLGRYIWALDEDGTTGTWSNIGDTLDFEFLGGPFYAMTATIPAFNNGVPEADPNNYHGGVVTLGNITGKYPTVIFQDGGNAILSFVDEVGITERMVSGFYDPTAQNFPFATAYPATGPTDDDDTWNETPGNAFGVFDWAHQAPLGVFLVNLSNMGVAPKAWTQLSSTAYAGGAGYLWDAGWTPVNGVTWVFAFDGGWASPDQVVTNSATPSSPASTSAVYNGPFTVGAGDLGQIQVGVRPLGTSGPFQAPWTGAQVGIRYIDVTVSYRLDAGL